MWVLFAAGSAVLAGLVAILAKVGIRHTSSNVATAIRTAVVLVLAWAIVFGSGSAESLSTLAVSDVLLLVASGLATGASWLCFFRALQVGPVTPVVVIDRSSIVLTVLVGMVFLGELTSPVVQLVGLAVIGLGTFLTIQREPTEAPAAPRRAWVPFAVGSAVFASLTAILAKVAVTDVDSNVATAIRTAVVLVLACGIVVARGEQGGLRSIPRRDVVFLVLSGLATGGSWLLFFRALQDGPLGGTVAIDKLSIVITALLAFAFLGERLRRTAVVGLVLVVAGTIALSV